VVSVRAGGNILSVFVEIAELAKENNQTNDKGSGDATYHNS
jgi:hypothetical protein